MPEPGPQGRGAWSDGMSEKEKSSVGALGPVELGSLPMDLQMFSFSLTKIMQ